MRTIAPLILASNSPRRKELFERLGLPFVVQTAEVAEAYASDADPIQTCMYLSEIKSQAIAVQNENAMVIGVDTLVYFQNQILSKPMDLEQARSFLSLMNGKVHQVFSGVSIFYSGQKVQFYERTSVEFARVDERIIDYYVQHYKPLDKAGAYGVQDFWGLTAVKRIEGDFYNVMGLPVHRLFKTLYDLQWIVE